MKTVSIIGLGWLGMPLAQALMARGYQVVGSKTSAEGVAAARLTGVMCYPLALTPALQGSAAALEALLSVEALIITLPPRRMGGGGEHYVQAVQALAERALAQGVRRIVFTGSTSVYGAATGELRENVALQPVTETGRALNTLEQWLRQLPGDPVDILRLAGLVGPGRDPGRFLAGKVALSDGEQRVNLVHQEDVIAAITLLLQRPRGGHLYNLCARQHPQKRHFYPQQAERLGLLPPQFCVTGLPQAERWVDGERICKELGFEYRYPDPATMPFA